MNSIMPTLKNLIKKISEGTHLSKKRLLAVSFLLTGAGMLVLSEMTNSETAVDAATTTVVACSTSDYVSDLENRLISIISSIEGAGETKVMITLESGSEEIYLHDYDYGENIDPSGKNIVERKDEYVIVDGDSGEKGIVVKVAEPQIRGVAVVCKGGDSDVVRVRIIETVTALLDITAACVSVAKMN